MSERVLAHIEDIKEINSIAGADRISHASVLGWRVIVQKDKHVVNEKCVYVEVDSLMPQIEYFKFLDIRKYRIRTLKMKGVLSQGLIIPLADIPVIVSQLKQLDPDKKPIEMKSMWESGSDVTELLGIKKWLTPEERSEISDANKSNKKKHNFFVKFMSRFSWYRKMFKMKSKSFPEWISKTDEERIQNVPWILDDEAEDWYVSEKLEGQSGTYWYKKKGFFGGEFGVCSRTVRKFEHDMSNWSKIARQYEIKKNLKFISKVYGDIAIQGEVIGEGIQGNIYGTKGLDFYVFNVYNIKEKKYYPLDKAQTITREIGLKFVPVLASSMRLPKTVELCLEDADGSSILNNTLREGKVYRKFDMSKSFKAVSNKYLLTKKD